MKKILIILIILAFSASVYAAGKDSVNKAYPWGPRSIEALGMGNAYFTKSDSKYAPFYNPAGLARVEKWRMELLPFAGAANKHSVSFVQDVMDIDMDNMTDISNMLESYIGYPMNGNFHFYPSFTRQNFTLGLYASVDINASTGNLPLPELNLDALAEAGLVFGLARSFIDDKLQVGVASRFLYRVDEAASYTFIELSQNEFDIDFDMMAQGYNLILDAGVIYNFWNDGINPRVGVAVNNISVIATGDVTKRPFTVTLSAGISPSFWIFNTDIIIDFRDVFMNFDEDNDIGKRLNLGAEIRFLRDIFALRAGLHQGYFTAGAGIDIRVIKLNYAYYREELGAYSGQRADERHAFELVFGF